MRVRNVCASHSSGVRVSDRIIKWYRTLEILFLSFGRWPVANTARLGSNCRSIEKSPSKHCYCGFCSIVLCGMATRHPSHILSLVEFVLFLCLFVSLARPLVLRLPLDRPFRLLISLSMFAAYSTNTITLGTHQSTRPNKKSRNESSAIISLLHIISLLLSSSVV